MRAHTSTNVNPGRDWKRTIGRAALACGLALGAYGWMRTPQPAPPEAPPPALPVAGASSLHPAASPESEAGLQVSPRVPPGSQERARASATPPRSPTWREASPERPIVEPDDEQRAARERAQIQAANSELGAMLASEAVDRDFRNRAEIAIGQALLQLDDSGTRLTSSDCRSTLCRLEFEAADTDAMNQFLEKFPSLLQWNTDMRASLQETGGGVAATVFITRDGVSMPALVADQAS